MADLPQLRRSTESYGLGQSGYTSGRRAGDPALAQNLEAQQRGLAHGADTHLELGDDERWRGRGGSRWAPATRSHLAQATEPRQPEPPESPESPESPEPEARQDAPAPGATRPAPRSPEAVSVRSR